MGRITVSHILWKIKNVPNHQTVYHHFRSLSSNGAAFFYSRPPPPLAAAGAAAALYIRPGTPRRGEANGDGSMANLAMDVLPEYQRIVA